MLTNDKGEEVETAALKGPGFLHVHENDRMFMSECKISGGRQPFSMHCNWVNLKQSLIGHSVQTQPILAVCNWSTDIYALYKSNELDFKNLK